MFSTLTIPTLASLTLSEAEQGLIKGLQMRSESRGDMELTNAYYNGEQIFANLRIAVPKELEFLRTIVGWPAMAVDPYVERLQVDGFRRSDATTGDQHIMDVLAENKFSAEQNLAFTDALAMKKAYWLVGSPTESGGAPVITVESPLNMAVSWDGRGTTPTAALQEYIGVDGRKRGALVLPRQTVQLAADDRGNWEVVHRDQHDFDFVPIVRMANRVRSSNRDGRSEISNALMALVDSACRTLLGLEVAREVYSTPQKVILGALESAFVKADGSAASALETYVTKVLALERDEQGNIPELHQWQVYDPSVFTKLVDMYAAQASGILAATPQDLGLYTEGNPVSADAANASEARRNRRADRMQREFGDPLVDVVKMALRFENKGKLSEEYRRLVCDWEPVSREALTSASDGVSKQVTAGSVPATSDVVLKRLGYTEVERRQLDDDRRREDARASARAIAESVAR